MASLVGTSPRSSPSGVLLGRAPGMQTWTWTWRRCLLSGDGLWSCLLPSSATLAPDDSDTSCADALTSSLTAGRDTKAREAHLGQSRKPCWSSAVFGDSGAFPQVPHVFGPVMYVSGVGWLVLQEEGTHVLGSVTSSGPCWRQTYPGNPPLLNHYLLPAQGLWATSFSSHWEASADMPPEEEAGESAGTLFIFLE